MYSDLNIQVDPWELSLDIDDFDVHLTLVLHPSSSTRVEPSPSTPNPVRIIPGLAGIVQQAKLLRERDIRLGWDEAVMSTQEYMKKVVEGVNEDKDFKSGSWISVTDYVNANGGTLMTMKDLSVQNLEQYITNSLVMVVMKKDIIVGAAMILANVSVFSPKPSMHYLNITKRNVVKVFRMDRVPGSGSG
uniref:Homologous recombination OB-fold protein OB-fold domain-containing protein n=1 Tax=Tanacetum cinerariifolium TaxID=118510 RepID=A0A699HH03_TANCI|nr:hypothetical protein [Tanacetum cinerariifolium]